MYNNLYKSSYVNQDEKVRIIQSNDLVAKKLDSIANSVIMDNSDEVDESIMQDVLATDVASLLKDEGEDGFRGIDISLADNKPGAKARTSSKDIQASSSQASDIIARATSEAEKIIQDAEAEADQIKEKAFAEAKEEGYNAGLSAGKKSLEEEEAKLKKKEEDLIEEYKAKIDEIEPSLVDVLTGIYEHVFHVDFSDRKEVIYHLAKNTLSAMESGKTYTLRLSPDDYNFLSLQKRDLVKGSGIPVESLEFVEDKSLTQGNAFIETDGGIFDCSVTTHMENLRKTLQILSYEKD